jgi:hypothetical protein
MGKVKREPTKRKSEDRTFGSLEVGEGFMDCDGDLCIKLNSIKALVLGSIPGGTFSYRASSSARVVSVNLVVREED